MDLAGKVVAITGASSGIGEATAISCVEAGGRVALGARRADRLEALARRLGDAAVAIEADVADEASARAFVRGAHDHFGRLDALVNNAGVMLLGPVLGADVGEWRRMVDVNCLGLLYCTHEALPLMQAAGSGHIVNVSSVAGRQANLGSAVYNLTKWGVNGFSEALRQEALHLGVRVTIIEPGMVETELLDHNEHKPYVMDAASRMKDQMGQALTSDDIARAILYALAQPEHVSINEVLVRPSRQQR
ncbi:MAG TPA: SDR family NAD(P)-dependent oxidoreductase [Baekduia sp.]|nr:SDR family NAD(P)-dependent oxidoreductase [Baekduia sp.]